MTIKKIKDMNENEEQAVIVSWCLQNGLVAVAVPNGFNLNSSVGLLRMYGLPASAIKTKNAIQIAKLKKEGLHVGFPDLMIFGETRCGRPTILFMENKVKNNKPSDAQLLCHEWLRELGYTVEISTDSKDAISKIKNYFSDELKQNICENYIKKRLEFFKRKKEDGKKRAKANVEDVPPQN